MKIKRISWTNYRGLEDGEIISDGSDVIVRGQNGAGKSSIASIVPFVLFGKEYQKARHYTNGQADVDNLAHGAEVEFDNGQTFRREVYCKENGGNVQQCFINGEIYETQKSFNVVVETLTRRGGELAFNPFAFCQLKADEQRKLLYKLFVTDGDGAILDEPRFAPLKDFLEETHGKISLDRYASSVQKDLKWLRGEAKTIPAKLTELDRLLKEMPANISNVVESLKAELATLNKKRDEVSNSKSKVAEEISSAKEERAKLLAQGDSSRRMAELERDKNFFTTRLTKAKEQTETLRAEYREVANSEAGKCPTCGQTIPQEKFLTKRDKELKKIIDDGWKARGEVEDYEQRLRDIDAELAELQKQSVEENQRREKISELDERLKVLSEQSSAEENQRREKLAELNEKISDVEESLTQLNEASKIQNRIAELRVREKDLNQQVVELERQARLIKDFQIRKVEVAEQAINANFEHVQFKMFELVITTGEVKPTCEAMLNGVPYSALSKGERLKAALDIFKTLQKRFEVEMPLLIDDAESYTRNSFVELPNQLWLFKVTDEEQLIIEVQKKARVAA